MYRHFYRLSIVTATLLIGFSCPLPVVGNSGGSDTALAQAQTIEERNNQALLLHVVGFQQYQKGQLREALETFQKALAIVREIGERKGEGVTLYSIGLVYEELGQRYKALENFQQALAIYAETGDQNKELATLSRIGLIYASLGQDDKALEVFQQALGITRTINNKLEEGRILGGIGSVYRNLEQYPKALEYFQQAVVIYRETDDKVLEGSALNAIGGIYDKWGQYPKALEFYTQALAIHEEIDDKHTKGATLNGLGLVYDSLGQYPKALDHFQQALALVQQLDDQEAEASTLNNIAGVYYNLGQYFKALENFQQALVIRQEIGDKVGEAATLSNTGLAYHKLGEYPKALENFQQALTITKEISSKNGEAATLNNIGLIYRNLGQYTKALESYSQALAITREIENKAGEGSALNNIGRVYYSLGQSLEALESFQQALAIFKEIGERAEEGNTLTNIGRVYNILGQYDRAENELFAAIEAWESLRSRELKDNQKISIFEQQAHTYRFLQQTLVAQNKFDQALEIAERSRGRALVELLDSKLSQNPNDQLNIKPPTIEEIKQIASERNATLVQYSVIPEPFKVQGKEEWQPSKLYIWIIKPTGEIAFKQVDLKSLDTSLKNLVTTSRDNIGVRGRSLFDVTVVNPQPENPTEKLRQLHQILIAPIADLLPKDPNERVIFIPQESLFLVPFPALQDEQGNYLIEKHTILTAPAIQVLDLTRKQKHNTQNSTGDVLIVGNPTMPKIEIGELVANLDPLPGAEREANQIADFFNTEALIGSQATKAAVMEKMQQARIIHLATHGLLHDFKGFGVPGAIALAPSGKPDDVVDGLLTAGEIFDMKLQADLVVLSACDTGRGDIKGDGVIGLSRSLISAGVPSILVSLWAVNDDSTAFLMTEFYRNLQQNPDKAVALRQAMLTTMKQYPNPKQWAAFTLIGEAE